MTGTARVVVADNEVDHVAPKASQSGVTLPKSGATYLRFKVVYTDNGVVDCATINTGDIRVTGPGYASYVTASLYSATPATGYAKQIVAYYQIPAPGGKWDRHDNGTYSISLVGKQVADASHNYAVAGLLRKFTINYAKSRSRPAPTLAAAPVYYIGQPAPAMAASTAPALFGNRRIFGDAVEPLA